MIVKTITDFCSISYDGNKIATSAHAAYWLACQHSIDCRSALETQEKDILDAFHKMASVLGYRVEKIAPEELKPQHVEFDLSEIIAALDETYSFAATSPASQDNINFVLEELQKRKLYALIEPVEPVLATPTPSRLEHLAGMTPVAEEAAE